MNLLNGILELINVILLYKFPICQVSKVSHLQNRDDALARSAQFREHEVFRIWKSAGSVNRTITQNHRVAALSSADVEIIPRAVESQTLDQNPNKEKESCSFQSMRQEAVLQPWSYEESCDGE